MEPYDVASVLRKYLDNQHLAETKTKVLSSGDTNVLSKAVFSVSNPAKNNPRTSGLITDGRIPSGQSSLVTPASMLLEQCLRNAAIAGGTSYQSILSMPCGPYKRNIVDDITVIVVLLNDNSSSTSINGGDGSILL
jgi:hypothetical protein